MPKEPARNVHEDVRDVIRLQMEHKAFVRSHNQRQMRFAHLKTNHGFELVRLRGLSGARDEFQLVSVVSRRAPTK